MKTSEVWDSLQLDQLCFPYLMELASAFNIKLAASDLRHPYMMKDNSYPGIAVDLTMEGLVIVLLFWELFPCTGKQIQSMLAFQWSAFHLQIMEEITR